MVGEDGQRKLGRRLSSKVQPWQGKAAEASNSSTASSSVAPPPAPMLQPQTMAECELMASSCESFLQSESAAGGMHHVTAGMHDLRRELTVAQQMLAHVDTQVQQAEQRRRLLVTSSGAD